MLLPTVMALAGQAGPITSVNQGGSISPSAPPTHMGCKSDEYVAPTSSELLYKCVPIPKDNESRIKSLERIVDLQSKLIDQLLSNSLTQTETIGHIQNTLHSYGKSQESIMNAQIVMNVAIWERITKLEKEKK